jgi:SprT protein
MVNDLEASARARTREWLQWAERQFGCRLPAVEVRFDLRGTSAGQARIMGRDRPAIIRYNAYFLARYRERFLDRTVPHEVAHVVCYHLYGAAIRPHGPQWRQVMQAFGADASPRHDFQPADRQTRRLRRYSYRCGCGPLQLTSIRHNRVLRGARYRCTRCGQLLHRDDG